MLSTIPLPYLFRGLISFGLILYGISVSTLHRQRGYAYFIIAAAIFLVRELSGMAEALDWYLIFEGAGILFFAVSLKILMPEDFLPGIISLILFAAAAALLGPGSPAHRLILSPMLLMTLSLFLHRKVRRESRHLMRKIEQLNESVQLDHLTLQSMDTLQSLHRKNHSFYHAVLQGALRVIQADTGAVLLIEDGAVGTLHASAVTGELPVSLLNSGGTVNSPETLATGHILLQPVEELTECLQGGAGAIIQNSGQDQRKLLLQPLTNGKKVFGLIIILLNAGTAFEKSPSRDLLEEYLNHAGTITDGVYSLIQSRENGLLEAETVLVGDIQKQLAPREKAASAGLDYAVFSRSAKGIHSDYWDTFSGKHNNTAFIMCDIAGKGILAAITMTIIRTVANIIGGKKHDAAKIVSQLNRAITLRINLDRFANLLYFNFNPENRTIDYAGAGHQHILIYRLETGTVERVQSNQPPLGINPNSLYSNRLLQMDSGDLLLAFTDGVVETMNPAGQQYSVKFMEELLKTNHQFTAEMILQALREDIEHFEEDAGNHDDQTLLILKIK